MVAPSARGREVVAQVYAHPDWATGFISSMDAWFLADCLAAFSPRTIIEIGVASGVSTAFLLRAIDLLGLDARLYSFDILPRYYADPGRKLGAFLDEVFDKAPARLSLFPGVRSVEAPARLRSAGVAAAELAFIDADHAHPWPCLDLLGLLPALSADAWIILHDIGLAALHPELPASGPAHLFDRWPGERRVFKLDGALSNIGAIRLLGARHDTADAILTVLEAPWQVSIAAHYFRPVSRLLTELGQDYGARLRTIHHRNVPLSKRLSQFWDRAAASLGRRLAARRRT